MGTLLQRLSRGPFPAQGRRFPGAWRPAAVGKTTLPSTFCDWIKLTKGALTCGRRGPPLFSPCHLSSDVAQAGVCTGAQDKLQGAVGARSPLIPQLPGSILSHLKTCSFGKQTMFQNFLADLPSLTPFPLLLVGKAIDLFSQCP